LIRFFQIIFDFTNFVLQKTHDEEFCDIYDDYKSERDLLVPYAGPKTNFYKYNRRLTEALCEPIIKLDKRFFYCGVARMPGLWIASIIKKSKKELVFNKTPIDPRSNINKLWKSDFYSRQEHLIESCTRQLMRKELESFLGECKYALTCYDQLIRYSIPYDERFMVFVNTDKNTFDSLEYVKRIVESIEDKKFKSDLIELCNVEQKLLEVVPGNKTKLINGFLHGKKRKNPVYEKLQEKFSPKAFITLEELFFQQFRNTKSKLNSMSANLFDIVMKTFNFEFFNNLLHQYQQEFSKGSPDTFDAEFNSKIRKFIEDALFDELDKNFHPTNKQILYEKEYETLIHNESSSFVDKTYSTDEQIRKTLIPVIIEKFKPVDNDFFNDKLEDAMLNHIKDKKINFLQQIRHAAIVSMKSYPLGFYIRQNTSMILTRFDQLDHLVEAISRQKLRGSTIQYFGRVRFTFSVYEKLARLTIPIGDDYVLFLTIDHDPRYPEEFYPPSILQILNELKSFDSNLFDQK